METNQRYVPALGWGFLTPLYDRVLRITMRDPEFKQVFLEQVGVVNGERVLDLGCGTGTLTALIAQQVGPSGLVYGVDIDVAMLDRAKTRIDEGSTVKCVFERGNATSIPLPDQSVDRVVSSLLFHHLSPEQKRVALSESSRVLKEGGTLHIVDWGVSSNLRCRLGFYLVQILDGFNTTTDNVEGRMPDLIADASFQDIDVRPCLDVFLGSLQCFHARRSA